MSTLKLEIESRMPRELVHICQSIGFWNEDGDRVYRLNQAKEMGDKFTQEQARKLSYEEYTINSLLSDLKIFSESKEPGYWPKGYKYGRGGSHIWVSNENNQRVLFIHF